jgi:hypothetical protein
MAVTVVACGHCRARFATTVPRDFIERVRRCGECGQRALVIESALNGATGGNGSRRQAQHGAPHPGHANGVEMSIGTHADHELEY